MDLQQIEHCHPGSLRPFTSNVRAHSKKQIQQIASSIKRFGFNAPVLIDQNQTIIAGHARVEAGKILGLEAIPVIRLSHLSDVERRAYILADNKLALNASWNVDLLATEVQYLIDSDFEVDLTGFSVSEIDIMLDDASERHESPLEIEETTPTRDPGTVSRLGDSWMLGKHKLLCADAREPSSYSRLLQGTTADLVFTDPPYNVPIEGHVSGLGHARHQEFAMAVETRV